MPYQVALTVVAPGRPGAVDDLKQLLATMGDGVANGSIIDFGALTGVHFARLILVDEDRDHSGRDFAGQPHPAQRPRRLPALRPAIRGLENAFHALHRATP